MGGEGGAPKGWLRAEAELIEVFLAPEAVPATPAAGGHICPACEAPAAASGPVQAMWRLGRIIDAPKPHQARTTAGRDRAPVLG